MTVQTFLVKNNGNTEPALFKKESLNIIGQLGRCSSIPAARSVARSSDLAQAMTLLEMATSLLQIELSFGIDERVCFLLPDAHHLGGLFFQRHSGKQIVGTFVRGEFAIPVRQHRSAAFFLHLECCNC